jgi:DNA repair ATPase RecN
MSRWYKTDLQIASPAGGFSMPNGDLTTPAHRAQAVSEYVQHIKDAGIEVFGVTDHNATTMLDEIRDETRKQGLVMFPGMEVSTGSGADGIHLLFIGDPNADFEKLRHSWETAAGFTKDHPAFDPLTKQHMPSSRSWFDILQALPEDTLAIAPHILADNGAGSGDSLKEGTLKWRALHNDGISAVDPGRPSGDGGWNDKFRERDLENYPVVKRMPFVSTSDAYNVDSLGDRFSWIRMHEPDLACLRQAFLDHGARILCDWDPRLQGDPNKITHAYISSLELDGITTSAKSLKVEFDPRINVIIGSRGSGKSTVIQGLRAVFGLGASLPAAVEDESNRYQDQVFSDATIKSSYVEGISGAGGEATWTRSEGTLSDNSLINVRVVTQKELFERTSGDRLGIESSSANMLILVDEALEDDRVAAELQAEGVDLTGLRPADFDESVEELRREYGQAVQIRLEAERKVAGRKKVSDELEEVKRKLGALDNEKDKETIKSANEVLADNRSLTALTDELRDLADSAEAITPSDLPTFVTTEAASISKPVEEMLAKFSTDQKAIVEMLRGAAKTADDALASTDDPFAKKVSEARAAKVSYKEKLEKLGVDMSQYEALQTQKEGYEEALSAIDTTAKELPALGRAETKAWTALKNLYATRLTTRSAFVEMVQHRTPSLDFSITAHADYAEWKHQVHRTLGFRQGDHVDALETLGSWLWSAEHAEEDRKARQLQWRQALLTNTYDKFPRDVTPAFIGRLKAATESTRIEVASLLGADAFDMRFLRAGKTPTDVDAWQTVTDGSPGQRSAAMLAFTLSYGDSPLVLDQPEDDLDSALVSQLIVQQFRDARWKRQLIVVTHEANIPVNTDAEVTVALESADGSLRIVEHEGKPVSGPIDDAQVRKQIQDLLEGGVNAFVNRERRYDNELSQYRRDVGLLADAHS